MRDFDHDTSAGGGAQSGGGDAPVAGFTAMGHGARTIGRQALALLGLFLLIVAIPIGFLTPFIPIGLPIGMAGSALLARNSVWGQRLVRYLLKRYPRLEQISPSWVLNLILGDEAAE